MMAMKMVMRLSCRLQWLYWSMDGQRRRPAVSKWLWWDKMHVSLDTPGVSAGCILQAASWHGLIASYEGKSDCATWQLQLPA